MNFTMNKFVRITAIRVGHWQRHALHVAGTIWERFYCNNILYLRVMHLLNFTPKLYKFIYIYRIKCTKINLNWKFCYNILVVIYIEFGFNDMNSIKHFDLSSFSLFDLSFWSFLSIGFYYFTNHQSNSRGLLLF